MNLLLNDIYIIQKQDIIMFESTEEDMVQFVSFTKDGLLELHEEGAKVIRNFMDGQINFIAFQGFHEKQYKISKAFTKSRIRSIQGNNVWIRPKPVFDKTINKYLFFLEASIVDEEAKQYCHTLISLISFLVYIAIEDSDGLAYLSAVQKRITDGLTSTKYFDAKTKEKMAQIVCLMEHNSTGSSLDDITEKLLGMLTTEGVQNQVLSSYPLVKCLGCPKQYLEYSSHKLQVSLLEQAQILSLNSRANSQLMYGPILIEYIQNIIKQLNNVGKVNTEKAQNQIEIEQAYQAYNSGVDVFHKVSLNALNQYQRPDDAEVTAAIDISRKAACEEYFKKGGSSNMKYKRLLDDYINKKQEEVKLAYTSEQKDKNLQILESESNIILDRIRRENKQKDADYIKEQIETMKRNYEHQAKGPEKHQLYNQYMTLFTPIAYGLDKKQSSLQRSRLKHQELQRKLKQLQKKKGGCCAGKKCEIM